MITQVGAAQAARTVGRAEMADMAEMTSTEHAFPSPGFADPTPDAQRVLRAVLDALSHPTRRYPLAGPPAPPAALGGGLAAIALALLDEDCTVWRLTASPTPGAATPVFSRAVLTCCW